MKKLILLLTAIFILSFGCKKEESVKPAPVYQVSADSAEAAKLNITTAQYIQIKGILNSLKDQAIETNSNTSNDITANY